MEYPSIKMLMEQIRDWAEEEDYDAIIEVLPELKTPGQFYEAVSVSCLCLFESGVLPRCGRVVA